MNHRADFAVIGGGPAGASAARRLAERGASVLLFERRPMPRVKPCAGALSAHGLACLGFELPAALVDRPVFGMRIHFRGTVAATRSGQQVAVLVTRSRFDEFLVSKAREAGAQVLWQEVKSLDVRGDGVVLATPDAEFTVRCAIVCEGATGRLSRAVRPPDAADQRLFCLAADVPVAKPMAGEGDGVYVDVFAGFLKWGYGWVFDHGSYQSVGITGLQAMMPQPLETFRRFVAERGLSLDGITIRGHFVPCGGIRRRVCADRLLLAGDAAGLADPFQGEGIAYAIRSGQLAAEASLAAAEQGDFSRGKLAAYEKACREAFEPDLKPALMLARWLSRWPSPVLRTATVDPALFEKYLLIPQGKLTYRRFVRWLATRAIGRWLRSGAPRKKERVGV